LRAGNTQAEAGSKGSFLPHTASLVSPTNRKDLAMNRWQKQDRVKLIQDRLDVLDEKLKNCCRCDKSAVYAEINYNKEELTFLEISHSDES
jgi:hypothetical protein